MKSRTVRKAIFIDWMGTLSTSLFWNKHNKRASRFARRWLFDENSELIAPWMKGQFSSEQICHKIADGEKVDYHTLFNELKQSFVDMRLCNPEVIDIVEKLRCRNFIVGIATDNMDTFLRFTVPSLDLEKYFDSILVSHALKAVKSDFSKTGDSLFFDDFIHKCGITYQDAVLFDDSTAKLKPLEKLGMQIIRIKSPDELPAELSRLL